MSVINSKGFPFVVLNEAGHYDIYDAKGGKIDMPLFKIRLTQSVNEIDQMIITAPVNVVTKDKMDSLIKEWNS